MSGPKVGFQAGLQARLQAGSQAAPHPGPHARQPVVFAGRPLAEATAAVILVHGRGATAEDILILVPEIDRPDLAYLAPQAAGSSWYPYSFMAPLEQNEPGLSSVLAVLGELPAGASAHHAARLLAGCLPRAGVR